MLPKLGFTDFAIAATFMLIGVALKAGGLITKANALPLGLLIGALIAMVVRWRHS